MLKERTEGEAQRCQRARKSYEDGSACGAYGAVFKCFMQTMGLALTERRRKVLMTPMAPKKRVEIVEYVAKWIEEECDLQKTGGNPAQVVLAHREDQGPRGAVRRKATDIRRVERRYHEVCDAEKAEKGKATSRRNAN